jgi:hypothetical protein
MGIMNFLLEHWTILIALSLLSFQLIAAIMFFVSPEVLLRLFMDRPIFATVFGILTFYVPLIYLPIYTVIHFLIKYW